jgi:hypothetical protein
MRLAADSTDATMLRGAARYAMRHNKGMKLTSVECIGRSQLIPMLGGPVEPSVTGGRKGERRQQQEWL